MNRREFLQCAAILVSGLGASQLGFSLSEEQMAFLANAPDFNTRPVDYFTSRAARDCRRDGRSRLFRAPKRPAPSTRACPPSSN